MLSRALAFFVVAIVAAALAVTAVAGTTAGIVKILSLITFHARRESR